MIHQPLPGMPEPVAADPPSSKRSCGGCGKSWGGLLAAHCGVCHQTFISVEYFDRHSHRPRLKVVR